MKNWSLVSQNLVRWYAIARSFLTGGAANAAADAEQLEEGEAEDAGGSEAEGDADQAIAAGGLIGDAEGVAEGVELTETLEYIQGTLDFGEDAAEDSGQLSLPLDD